MRVKRVGLEYHRQTAFRGRHMGRIRAVDVAMPDAVPIADRAQQRATLRRASLTSSASASGTAASSVAAAAFLALAASTLSSLGVP